ncbi:MAG: hypothetical protein CME64_09395 [Halobacteriovoraceae bacterium]|nr:hypothetical protein [Halobacteriovoraceae bacterium]
MKFIIGMVLVGSFSSIAGIVDDSIELVRSSCGITYRDMSASELRAELAKNNQLFRGKGLAQFLGSKCINRDQVNKYIRYRNEIKESMEKELGYEVSGVGGEEIYGPSSSINMNNFTDINLVKKMKESYEVRMDGYNCAPISCLDYLKISK